MSIAIRHVEDADYAAINAFFHDESVIAQTSQLPHRTEEFWRRFYTSLGGECIELVALIDGAVAGHLGILLNTNPRRKHVASFGLAVAVEHQRRGVGDALMTELLRLADNWLNVLKIELTVFADNEAAIALYRKHGFVVEGESRFDSFRNGHYATSLAMARIRSEYGAPAAAKGHSDGESKGSMNITKQKPVR